MDDYQIQQRASEIVNDPVIQEVFSRLQSVYVATILNSSPEDTKTREIAYQRAIALDEIRADLRSLASSGKVTEFNRRLRARTV
jgi:hypothetical protein